MLSLLSSLAFAEPVFSVERGLFAAPLAVSITGGLGGVVQYGLGGATPDRPYVAPLEISRTTVVRATETLADGTVSAIVTHTYVFVDDVVASPVMDPAITGPNAGVIATSLRALPTVSIALPSALSLDEAGGSVEWIDPEGDESQVDCGVHIVGGTSWAYAKASIRLNFREEYGPTKWEHDVYGEHASGVRPTDSFDAITLRSGNHDTVFYLAERGQHLRNLWVDETQLAMGHVMPHGRFAHAYVNGVYHGLFHVRERFGAGFMESYFGGDEADYETMTGSWVEDGTGAGWAAATAVSGDFEAFREWVNVPQYLDYMVMNYYAGNAWDWYSWHNWMTSGPTTADARGGFIFHANDNDITLKYEWDVNILALGGPSDVFPALLAEGHPDFQVALADAIHRNFESDGPLTAENAIARYERVADLADDAIWVESARWGLGWWDHDGEWVPERDALLTGWFPRRTDETLRQFRAAGWYPLGAPVFDVAEGAVAAGTVLTITPPGGALWVTTDGRDPRLAGGDVAPTAASGLDTVVLDRSTVVRARVRDGAVWGPLESAFYEIDSPSAVILNEWNAAEPDALLADGDTALGRLAGNGGDWIELVVTEDGADLRGWRIAMEDRVGAAGELTLSDDPLLADLRAGTLLTIAEDLPEDAAYDPDGGDWRFHLRAGALGGGRYVSAEAFDVTALDWRLTLFDAAGNVRFGPVGESVEPRSGIGSDEVGRLQAQADAGVRRDDGDYGDGSGSSYGSPNTWSGGVQDLGWDPEIAPPVATEEADPGSAGPAEATDASPNGGCATAPAAGWLAILALLAACGRGGPGPLSRPAEDAPEATGPPAPADAPEQCNGADDDGDGAIDEDAVDALPFYRDGDEDGFGGGSTVTACAFGPGLALADGDCDDADPARHPDAPELCDTIDQNCDGEATDAEGASADCAAESCLALLDGDPAATDGPYWLALASGGAEEVWCDMARGGWTLGFLRNSASLGSQLGFGGSDQPAGALGVSPAAASSSGAGHLGWIDLEAGGWTTLVVAAYAGGEETYRSREISREDLRVAFGSDGYLLYGAPTGYFWCGGAAAYTDGGVGAVNNPAGAPADCKGHGSLGTGWDFSESNTANRGLTLCGADASSWLYGSWASDLYSYGTSGGAQALWVR